MRRTIARAITAVIAATLLSAGTVAITASPAAAVSCGQSTHVFVYGMAAQIPVGTTLYPSGVVMPNSQAYFAFELVTNPKYPYGPATIVAGHWTQRARSNCVIHHEPEARSTAGWPTGLYRVKSTFQAWETGIFFPDYVVGFFTLS